MFGRRIEALDGLRGVALLGVLVYHAAPGVVRGGYLGVEMFFVLSGFLLGSILLAEHRRRGAIDLGAYAERRLRRIVPAMLVLVAALLVAVPFLARDDVWRLRGDVFFSVAGLTNWRLIWEGTSYFGGGWWPAPALARRTPPVAGAAVLRHLPLVLAAGSSPSSRHRRWIANHRLVIANHRLVRCERRTPRPVRERCYPPPPGGGGGLRAALGLGPQSHPGVPALPLRVLSTPAAFPASRPLARGPGRKPRPHPAPGRPLPSLPSPTTASVG